MSIEKLLSIASPATFELPGQPESPQDPQCASKSFDELRQMLTSRNGFYAFSGALHVLPSIPACVASNLVGIEAWNGHELWRDLYLGVTDDLYFFAEDAFGGQFAIRDNDIVSFDPESGEIQQLAQSLEEWAEALLVDYRQLTGYPLAASWQEVNGPLPMGKRLLPKIPFILGGPYEVRNLYAVDAVKGMRYRGELWSQLRNLPEGAQVRLKPLPLQ